MFYCTYSSHTMLMGIAKKVGGKRKLAKKFMKLLNVTYKDAVALTKGIRKNK